MGLFANAIADHLELKRRHGADPKEVAQLENEALGPAEHVEGYDGILAEEQCFSLDADLDDPLAAYATSVASRAYDQASELSSGAASELSPETMEIDMRAVMGAMGAPRRVPIIAADRGGDIVASGSRRPPDIADPAADLDWEIPARARRAS
ncbi:MAG: hypothetical protein ACYCUM_14060 [Solirubrobacteraceae bacterium]